MREVTTKRVEMKTNSKLKCVVEMTLEKNKQLHDN